MSITTAAIAADAATQLHALFDEQFEWRLREHPEQAMQRGDYRYADRITDNSLAAIERRHRETQAFLDRLHAIDKSELNETDLVSYELFDLEMGMDVAGHRFRTFLMSVGGRFGPQTRIAQMHERVRFETRKDYVNYIQRLRAVEPMVDNAIALMKLGLAEGRTPARATMHGLPRQFDAILSDGLNELRTPFEIMPAEFPDPVRIELTQRFDQEVAPLVRAAVTKLRDFVINDYLPKCREEIAAHDLPDGEAFYAHQLRLFTTTDLTAKEIHEIGLREVARIKAEMMQVIARSDFLEHNPSASSVDGDALFKAFLNSLRTDSRFYYDEPEDLLRGYRDICKRVDGELPKFFRTLPRLPYGVKAIPAFMAPQQTTAYYQHGDIRNNEAGYFYANTYALDQRPKYEMIPLAMHEAVPGHHLQISLSQEIESLPEFRKDAYFVAFGEGWALYSERLGIEMGFYEDPYDDFGRLLYEMWRACRLVVDPGMHALGWSRDRAIQFMKDNTALSELNITTEIDRYINWPGQACAYKIGELKIRELRAKAERDLGVKFDLREFHEVILGAGAVPLTVLERRVDVWIDSVRADAARGG